MTPPPIRSIFLPRLSYPHDTDAHVSTDDECIICRETYASPGQPGCHAIRLTHCGHVVGGKCFHQWITRHPEICPCLPHPLPATRTPTPPEPEEDPLFIALLAWLCNSAWFAWLDDYARMAIRNQTSEEALGLHAVSKNLAIQDHVFTVAARYTLTIIFLDLCAVVASLGLCVLACALHRLGMATNMWVFLAWVALRLLINTAAFLFVVWGVSRAALLRSGRNWSKILNEATRKSIERKGTARLRLVNN